MTRCTIYAPDHRTTRGCRRSPATSPSSCRCSRSATSPSSRRRRSTSSTTSPSARTSTAASRCCRPRSRATRDATLAAQVLGTVGQVTPQELKSGNYPGAKQGEVVGQTGLEAPVRPIPARPRRQAAGRDRRAGDPDRDRQDHAADRRPQPADVAGHPGAARRAELAGAVGRPARRRRRRRVRRDEPGQRRDLRDGVQPVVQPVGVHRSDHAEGLQRAVWRQLRRPAAQPRDPVGRSDRLQLQADHGDGGAGERRVGPRPGLRRHRQVLRRPGPRSSAARTPAAPPTARSTWSRRSRSPTTSSSTTSASGPTPARRSSPTAARCSSGRASSGSAATRGSTCPAPRAARCPTRRGATSATSSRPSATPPTASSATSTPPVLQLASAQGLPPQAQAPPPGGCGIADGTDRPWSSRRQRKPRGRPGRRPGVAAAAGASPTRRSPTAARSSPRTSA